MGYVRVKGLIGRRKEKLKEIEFLVDTGAFYTIVPPGLAAELGLEPQEIASLVLADSRTVEAEITVAYIKLLDREGVVPVAILETPEPLLGATALEGLGLRVDPATGALEHSRPYGLAAL
ncbi:MAG: aspartyl protease family protein [Nitrososphaerota archaeon]